ncbi:MAG: alpha/beta fold hydrolase, partial [Bacteroidota bacterium]
RYEKHWLPIRKAADYLGIHRIRLLMGGSMGGQHALEWASLHPNRFDLLCVLATNAFHSAWGIAFNETQRMALRADQTLGTGVPEAGKAGLEAARAIGMLSYRHYRTYIDAQTGLNTPSQGPEDYRATSYQRYQGNKLWKRFEPTAYYALSRGMDSHHLGRGRTSEEDPDGLATGLSRITATSLVIGIDTDILFPLEEQGLISRHIPNSRFEVIHSDYGHDGFLTEAIPIGELLADFLADQLKVDQNTKHAFTESLTGRKFALPGTEEV